ncbi:MAG: hypothetical protein IKH27_02115 [Oscillospiraceae bacterium]|nr:hypothetical protein [Oscillospiraceae bacterium]MBR3446586.1 hypothetical protein [Oscillospiraceae bacterium]
MKLIRLWRQYDSFKAAVLLFTLAAILIGYCIHAAAGYASILRTPTEYICTLPEDSDTLLLRLAQTDSVKGYSRQKKASLMQENNVMTVTLLSAAYLSDCYGITEQGRVIFANDAAFSAFCGDTEQGAVQMRGTLDGNPFSAAIIRTDALPDSQPLAVTAVSMAELHESSELRICMTEPDSSALEQLGLHIVNPEVQLAAEYDKEFVLLRIRFGALAALLSCIAAVAFLQIYRNHTQS